MAGMLRAVLVGAAEAFAKHRWLQAAVQPLPNLWLKEQQVKNWFSLVKKGQLLADQVGKAASASAAAVQRAAAAAAGATGGEEEAEEEEGDEEEEGWQEEEDGDSDEDEETRRMAAELATRLAASQRLDGRERRKASIKSQVQTMQLADSKTA
ncbi:hypothetical protein C2E20_2023 [Micractinium conductrix]|uniref:Uncharacterized protein n=1 Tax=Micractinium conductrix TaxID=554055 RepID=A0A2P6VM59_9CHLO|nr:hypothetical protein C2E20_2023 [Micractinium conductrix]|eukprot:PSC75170.1 hypothetical protein C2E20_2023 [Micractinium conductrix]